MSSQDYLRPIAIVVMCRYNLAVYGMSCRLPIRSLWCVCAGGDFTCCSFCTHQHVIWSTCKNVGRIVPGCREDPDTSHKDTWHGQVCSFSEEVHAEGLSCKPNHGERVPDMYDGHGTCVHDTIRQATMTGLHMMQAGLHLGHQSLGQQLLLDRQNW